MPIYEYRCKSCGEVFEQLVLGGGLDDNLSCPKCGSKDIEKAMSAFSSAGGSRSESSVGCSSSGRFT